MVVAVISLCASYVLFLNFQDYDKWGQYAKVINKQQVACPRQTSETAVIFAFGQSNIANYADHKFKTKYPSHVLNFFQGRCYTASSPLLGASGRLGEYLTPLGDYLIESKAFKDVILISSGIGNTSIVSWNEGGTANPTLIRSLSALNGMFNVNYVIWHQGERDFLDRTTSDSYKYQFKSLQALLVKRGVLAPIFIAISTKCGLPFFWESNNPISDAQQSLIDNISTYKGANTDINIDSSGRALINPCHLSFNGQINTSKSFADAILAHKNVK